MILRKDPLVKQLFIRLFVSLVILSTISILVIFSIINKTYINNEIILSVIATFALMIIINIAIFMTIIKSFINKLEKFSLLIDRIMDGEVSNHSQFEEEGILSRLGSQFSQMTRRLNISLRNLKNEKENIKSLVTDISHQVKTPVASIKLFNTILIEENVNEEEKHEFLEKIKEDVNKLEWLVNSLIKMSRLEVGMIKLKKEKFSIEQTLIESINGIYLKVLEKRIDINLDVKADIEINHDVKWTKEAIINVLENAVKYTDKGGQIEISVEKLETYIKIDIKDDGIGIPDSEIGKVFNRFYRGESKVVRESEGSGVGLYLTRKILEEQGGSIIVSSDEGKGSKFTILMTI